jgi:sugar O-acyltransferase (sialic acid O-acetyltransferase NeuD family)
LDANLRGQQISSLVLFATGSPLVVDYEESARRGRVAIVAGIRNFDGPVFVSGAVRVLGSSEIDAELFSVPFIVPLFTPGHRHAAVSQATALGFGTPARLIDPTSILPSNIEIGAGTYVNAGCTLGAASHFDEHVLINRGATIGHHCEIAAFVSIGPGAVLAGQIKVGRGATIGAGAVVRPEIVIGRNAVVGAGAVVTKDVPDGTTVVGNPARVIETARGGYKGLSV